MLVGDEPSTIISQFALKRVAISIHVNYEKTYLANG